MFSMMQRNATSSTLVFRFRILRPVISVNVFRGFPRFKANVRFVPTFQDTLHDYHATFHPNRTMTLLNLFVSVQWPQRRRISAVSFIFSLTCFYGKVEWAISGYLQSCKLSCLIWTHLISVIFRRHVCLYSRLQYHVARMEYRNI